MFNYGAFSNLIFAFLKTLSLKVLKTNFISIENQGSLFTRYTVYKISTDSFHTTFSIPLDFPSIHTVYWHVAWTRRNPATTVKFRIHTFHIPPSIPPVTHSIHYVYWNVYWHIRNPATSVKFRIHIFHVPPSIPPVTHSIHDVYDRSQKPLIGWGFFKGRMRKTLTADLLRGLEARIRVAIEWCFELLLPFA